MTGSTGATPRPGREPKYLASPKASTEPFCVTIQ